MYDVRCVISDVSKQPLRIAAKTLQTKNGEPQPKPKKVINDKCPKFLSIGKKEAGVLFGMQYFSASI